jgi:hypothetical protein
MGDVQKHIRDLAKTGDEIYAKVCEVIEVDAGKRLCDVKPLDGGAELFDIPYSADVQGDGLVLHPKKGSNVLVVFLDKHNAQICNVSELDKLYLKIGGVEFRIDNSGFVIKKGNDTLVKILDDLLLEIKLIIVPTNVGPSGNPLNAMAFDAIKMRIDNLLK